MPNGGDLEVSAQEANQAAIIAPLWGILWGGAPSPTTTWEYLVLSQSRERRRLCQNKVKATDGNAATAVGHFILFPSYVLRIILRKKKVDPLQVTVQSILKGKK